MSFVDLASPAGLKAFDDYIAAKNFIQGYMPTSLDAQAFQLFKKAPAAQYTHALRYYNTVAQYKDMSSFREGAGVPEQIAGSVKAPAVSSAKPAAKPASSPAPAAVAAAPAASPASADVAAIEKAIQEQGEVVRKLKADKVEQSVLKPEIEKLLALKAQLPKDAAAGGDKKEGKKDKKKDKKKEGEKKEEGKGKGKGKEEKAAPKADGEYDAKLLAKVAKEGGKKGQDIVGVYEMGGLEFFCTTIDTPDGDLKLCNIVLENMNKEIEEGSEERRGGSAEVGKMLFSAGQHQLAVVARIPKNKTDKLNTKEWLQHVLGPIGGEIVGDADAEYAQGIAKADPSKNRFSIKMKDEAISLGVGYLKSKGCFPDAESSSGSEYVYGDEDFDI